jgi:hypothetical protein
MKRLLLMLLLAAFVGGAAAPVLSFLGFAAPIAYANNDQGEDNDDQGEDEQ